jgi:RHS repeat-associated protein
LTYSGTLLMKVSTEGATFSFTYGNGGKIARITDQSGRFAEYEYNDLRHELNVIHLPDGAKIKFGYDHEHRMTSISNPNGDSTLTNEYDEAGRVHVQRDFYGATRTMIYTPDEGKTTVIEDGGRTTVYHFDSRYRETEVEHPDGTSEQFVYDGNDNITSKTDRNGNTMTFQYDLMGNLHQVVDPYGSVTTIQYNSFNKPIQVTDPLGNMTTLDYDDKGNITGMKDALQHSYTIVSDNRGVPTSITNPKGETVVIKNDAFGFSEFVTDPLGFSQHLQRDELHRVTSITDTLNQINGVEYDTRDRIISRTDALQQKEEFKYDSDSNLIYHRDPAGGETHLGYSGSFAKMTYMDKLVSQDLGSKQVSKVKYDVFGNIGEMLDPKGAVTQYHYNNVNRLDKMIVHDKDDQQNDILLVTHFEYDGNGNLTKKTDPKGNVTLTQYDKRNLPISMTDASGAVTTYEYDKPGRLTKVTNALGNSTMYEYDALGQIVKETDASLHSTTFVYDEVGLLISAVKANGAVWTMKYDARGMLVGTINPLGNTTSLQRDGLGRVISSKDESGVITKFNYDALGRTTSIIDALNQGTNMSYDPVGRIQAITDAKQQTTSYAYDLLGRLTSVTNALGATTRYSYDAVGNITSKTDALDRLTSYQYNMRDQLIAEIDPLQQETKLFYDGNGNVQNMIQTDGQTTSYKYDPMNRLTQILYADSSNVQYTYDSLGRRMSMQDSQGTTKYAYDVLDRLTQVTDAANQRIGYEWTPTNQRSKVIYPDGRAVSYGYDLMDRMTSVTDGYGQLTNYTYDAKGLLTGKTLPNQVQSSYHYDALGQLLNMKHVDARGKILEQLSYEYDPVGNRTSMERTAGWDWNWDWDWGRVGKGETDDSHFGKEHYEADKLLTEYAYDALNQLVQVREHNVNDYRGFWPYAEKATGYGNNQIGKIQTPHDDHHAFWSEAKSITTNYTYDQAGNRLSKSTAWGDLTKSETYTYNEADRLTHWENGFNFKDYTYDPRGNLLKVTGLHPFDDYDRNEFNGGVTDNVYGMSVSENVYQNTVNTNTYGWFQQTPGGNQDGFNYGNIGNYWFGNDRGDLYGDDWGHHDGDNSHDRDGYKKWTKTMEQYSWNAANRLEQQINWKGEMTKFSYDGDGNRLSMTSGYFKDWNPGRDADWNWGSDGDFNWKNLDQNFQDSGNNDGHGNKGGNPNQGYHGYQPLTQEKFTNDVSLPLPEVIQVVSNDRDTHHDQQRTTFVFGPDQERLSMTREGFVDGDYDHGNGNAYGHENGGRFPNTSYYVQDALGSTIAMLNQKGHLTERNHYDEFGNPEARGYGFGFGSSHDSNLGNAKSNGYGYGLGNEGLYHGNGNLFGYTGLEYDGSTGLNYARARYYKPEIGRFISEDTYKGSLWNPQSQNQFTYVHNNPLKYTDPTGHATNAELNNALLNYISNDDNEKLVKSILYGMGNSDQARYLAFHQITQVIAAKKIHEYFGTNITLEFNLQEKEFLFGTTNYYVDIVSGDNQIWEVKPRRDAPHGGVDGYYQDAEKQLIKYQHLNSNFVRGAILDRIEGIPIVKDLKMDIEFIDSGKIVYEFYVGNMAYNTYEAEDYVELYGDYSVDITDIFKDIITKSGKKK